ncbi:Aspartate aminotransferase [Labilithrix luteola]|uniref:Aspartate aminotransferase n=1 Tax=Labilithrix luteola TaxID=1391654 RepID=A0A0K1PTD2_9BACT|nr:pyridoxal phosphate-dependent aminotransferase [Labilithrix luteola]AKU96785.1 Aspartate aminotransferase [Labilithrix luteola]
MFGPSRYISWVRKFYGHVPYDLGTSGIPNVSWGEMSAGATLPPIDDTSGYGKLVAGIARHNDVPASEVIPALGTAQALHLAYTAVLSPGDEVLLEHPVYEPLVRIGEGVGAVIRTYERRADEGFRVDPERIAAQMTPRTRLIVVTNLHNPTGVRVPDETLRELAKIAEAHSAYLLVDEVYAPFDDLPEDGIFRRSARKLGPNVMAVSSLTKCYGLGTYRVGWMLAPEHLIAEAEATTIATVGHLPLSHAHLGVTALEAVGSLAKRAKALLVGKRELAEQWVSQFPRARWSAPKDGLFGLVTIDGADNLLPRIETNIREHGVLVGPGSFFGIPNGFRLSWATLPAEEFKKGLERLEPLVAG